MYLLDTNICIYAINKKPAVVLNALRENADKGIYISSLTVAELAYGIENSLHIEKNRIALLKFLSIFTILNFDDADAVQYGRLKARLKKEGKLIGPIDMLLAAQAMDKDLTLVTNDTAEFRRIHGLRVEDWTA